MDVICPGFMADCLETLEEIDQLNRETFVEAGGGDFHYVPWGNDSEGAVASLEEQARIALAGSGVGRAVTNDRRSETLRRGQPRPRSVEA